MDPEVQKNVVKNLEKLLFYARQGKFSSIVCFAASRNRDEGVHCVTAVENDDTLYLLGLLEAAKYDLHGMYVPKTEYK